MAANWEIAKALLKEDWCAGMIPLATGPSEVHIFRLEHEAVPHQNFSANLNALRKKLDSQQKTTASDDAALAKDVELHPINMNPVGRPCPRWDGSDAQRLLKQDVALEKHKTMTPRALRMTSVEHQRGASALSKRSFRQTHPSGRPNSPRNPLLAGQEAKARGEKGAGCREETCCCCRCSCCRCSCRCKLDS
jgi:hypothetical protein